MFLLYLLNNYLPLFALPILFSQLFWEFMVVKHLFDFYSMLLHTSASRQMYCSKSVLRFLCMLSQLIVLPFSTICYLLWYLSSLIVGTFSFASSKVSCSSGAPSTINICMCDGPAGFKSSPRSERARASHERLYIKYLSGSLIPIVLNQSAYCIRSAIASESSSICLSSLPTSVFLAFNVLHECVQERRLGREPVAFAMTAFVYTALIVLLAYRSNILFLKTLRDSV